MTSRDLTPEQARAMHDAVRERTNYLEAMIARMDELKWPDDDPVLRATVAARDAMHRLAGVYLWPLVRREGLGTPPPKGGNSP